MHKSIKDLQRVNIWYLLLYVFILLILAIVLVMLVNRSIGFVFYKFLKIDSLDMLPSVIQTVVFIGVFILTIYALNSRFDVLSQPQRTGKLAVLIFLFIWPILLLSNLLGGLVDSKFIDDLPRYRLDNVKKIEVRIPNSTTNFLAEEARLIKSITDPTQIKEVVAITTNFDTNWEVGCAGSCITVSEVRVFFYYDKNSINFFSIKDRSILISASGSATWGEPTFFSRRLDATELSKLRQTLGI